MKTNHFCLFENLLVRGIQKCQHFHKCTKHTLFQTLQKVCTSNVFKVKKCHENDKCFAKTLKVHGNQHF